MKNIHNELTDRLFETILGLNSIDECYAFFEDLCTVNEIRDMSQRLEVARLIDMGLSYNQIFEKTGVSTATIGRVKKCVDYGEGGYQAAIERFKKAEDK